MNRYFIYPVLVFLAHSLLNMQNAMANDSRACVELGEEYTVTITLRNNEKKSKKVSVGKPATGSPGNSAFDRGCMGRCGEGCGRDGGQGNYAYDCLAHDVCAFFDSKYGGLFDRDCGDEFRRAINDTVTVGRSRCWKSKRTVQRFLNR